MVDLGQKKVELSTFFYLTQFEIITQKNRHDFHRSGFEDLYFLLLLQLSISS